LSRADAAKLAVENAKRRKAEQLARQQQQQEQQQEQQHPPQHPPQHRAKPHTDELDEFAEFAVAGASAEDDSSSVVESLDALPDDDVGADAVPRSAPRSVPLPSARTAAVKSPTQYGQISQIMRPGASVVPPSAVPPAPSSPSLVKRGVSLAVVGTKASRAAGAGVVEAAAPMLAKTASLGRGGSERRVARERSSPVAPLPSFAQASHQHQQHQQHQQQSTQVQAVISPRHAPSSPPPQSQDSLKTRSLGDRWESQGSIRVGYSGAEVAAPYSSSETTADTSDELSRAAVLTFGRDPQHTDSLTAHDLRGFPWYFGQMSADEAFARLRTLDVGHFLVRLSSTPKCFTISWVKAAKTIVHTKVSPTDFGWQMDGEPNKEYLSVWDVVTRHKKLFQTPLRGPFIVSESKD
jgi:hypothetical protein